MPAAVHAQARAPHMTAMAVTTAAAGALQIASGSLPANLAATASPTVGYVWSALLVVGGILVVVGAWMRPVDLGLRLEAAGHGGLIFGTATYLVSAMTWMTGPWWVSPAVWWAVAVIAASFVRWWQITRVLWAVRHV